MTLEELLTNPQVEDIVLNPRGLAWFSEGSWKGPIESEATQPASLQALAQKIAEEAHSSLGLTQPSVDAYFNLSNGESFRAHVAISPLVMSGTEITLRRLPSLKRFSLADFCTPSLAQAFEKSVQRGASILIAGSTGSGKTSLLSTLISQVSSATRVLVLEDSPEIPLPTPLSSRLLARSNRFGFRNGALWDLSHLVFESLRMRPDRLILGECRGPEALAIATALQTGHQGLMTTLHSGSCRQALERFQALASNASGDRGYRYDLLWDIVAYIEQEKNGQREVKELYERPTSAAY